MYDVIVVGGGPAGLSAALVLGRCRRSVLVCDAGRPRNASAQHMHGYLGHDHVKPMEFLRIGRDEIARYGVEHRDANVVDARILKEGFEVSLSDGNQLRCRRLLLATGVTDELPAIDGAVELFGKSLWHCPYCDGFEARDLPLAVYGKAMRGYSLALGLLAWSKDIVLCSDGPLRIRREHRERLERHAIDVRTSRIARLEGTHGQLERIVFVDGSTLARQGMFFSTAQSQSSDLARRLGCRFNSRGTVITTRKEETGVRGLYVVGDASHDVQFVVVAAAEGAKAALMINTSFQEEETR